MTASSVVTTRLMYPRPPESGVRAFQTINANPETGERDKNFVLVGHDDVKIENVRGKEDSYTLDNAGFQFYNRPTKFREFQHNERIQEEYYPECVELIKELTKASRVLIFDHSNILPASNT